MRYPVGMRYEQLLAEMNCLVNNNNIIIWRTARCIYRKYISIYDTILLFLNKN